LKITNKTETETIMTKGEWIVYDSCIAQYLVVDGIVFYPFILIAKKQCDS